MREIKFRAWDKDRKVIIKDEDIDHIDFKKGIVYWYDIEGSYDENGDTEWRQVQAVSNNVVLMQYTGLKDKNGKGKEIYEGDIVVGVHWEELDTGIGIDKRSIQGDPFEVKWDEQVLGWNLYGWEDFEIIGNIYENPEPLN